MEKQKQLFTGLDEAMLQKMMLEIADKLESNPEQTLQEIAGLKDDNLEEIYSLAYTYYNQGIYKDAYQLFGFLAGVAPLTYKFVFGLAATEHQLGEYKEAMDSFLHTTELEPRNPLSFYYLADCFLKLGHPEEAKRMALLTAEICEDKPEYAQVKSRCELLASSLPQKNRK
jgi:type III secretion system low calcium response chaperone LcrH/SycD